MQLRTEVVGDVGVIRVCGDLDAIHALKLQEAASEALGDGARSLVIDCQDIGFIASDGLRVMVRAYKQAHAQGGTVTIRRPSALTYRLMQITCLDTVFLIDGLPEPSADPIS
jgi:anti-sigma B factor antagonist